MLRPPNPFLENDRIDENNSNNNSGYTFPGHLTKSLPQLSINTNTIQEEQELSDFDQFQPPFLFNNHAHSSSLSSAGSNFSPGSNPFDKSFQSLKLDKVHSLDSDTTLRPCFHFKNDSNNSINSQDTLSSYRLRRFNSASSIDSFNSINSSGGNGLLKKIPKYPIPDSIKLMTSSQLSDIIDDLDILILDVRPYIDFNASHLKNAINFNLPSTLLKRPNFTLSKCLNNLSLLENVKLQNFMNLKSNENKKLIVYDDNAIVNDECGLNVYGSLSKFLKDETFQGELLILSTGFNGFQSEFPNLVELNDEKPVDSPKQQHPPHNRSLSLANFTSASMMNCNNKKPNSPNLSRFHLPKLPRTPVFKIRHNEEFYDFDNYKVLNDFKYLSSILNSDSNTENLPIWLTDLLSSNSSLSLLEKFKNLEIEEKKRINSMISSNSIGFGIELGLKNRYKDIFPYEHSRVKLSTTSSGENNESTVSDKDDYGVNYINANYISCPEMTKFNYIATQAPLFDTLNDFNKLIDDNNVEIVITLTNQFENGVEKCYPYWNNEQGYEVLETFKLENLIIRRLFIKEYSKEIIQIQIISWNDFDIMINNQQDEVLKLIHIKKVLMESLPNNIVLVHCSAGCGRTGTFCTLDSIINTEFSQSADKKDKESGLSNQFDPVFTIVENFRNQRISMVQNLRQYLFIYDCLINYYQNFRKINEFEELNNLDIITNFIKNKQNQSMV